MTFSEVKRSSAQSAARVSVVMGCYNVASSVEATIHSLQGQSMRDWELVVVDDGSTDETLSILQCLAEKDSRIRILTQPNRGLTRALIAGCEAASAEFIARQDAGDFSLPDRFRVQLEYLEGHLDVVAVGCDIRYIGPEGEYLGDWIRHQSPAEITEALLHLGTGFVHPSVMFRREAYTQSGGYRPQFRYAQDHDLWYRFAEIGLLGNCPEVLFEYRQDLGGVSPENRVTQKSLGELARWCFELRKMGQSENSALEEAERLSNQQRHSSQEEKRQAIGKSAYFIGSRLYAQRDARCRQYFQLAIASRAQVLRSAVKYLCSLCFLRSPR